MQLVTHSQIVSLHMLQVGLCDRGGLRAPFRLQGHLQGNVICAPVALLQVFENCRLLYRSLTPVGSDQAIGTQNQAKIQGLNLRAGILVLQAPAQELHSSGVQRKNLVHRAR